MTGQPHQFDVAVIGGGIVGLAHAWLAARRGLSVVLFERDRPACGASVRNFGMIWPIGQPAGELFELALRGRAEWLRLAREASIWVRPCGSIHLARHRDELAVLEEFVSREESARDIALLSAAEVTAKSPGANPEGLLGGMWSPHELCVNPAQAIAQLTRYLATRHRVQVCLGETVTVASEGYVRTATGKEFRAARIALCSGSDFETLFPETFRSAGLQKCKLQMMATVPQADSWRLGPHLAGGLTMRFYKAFEACESLAALRQHIAREHPQLDRFGIHTLASQNDSGQIILGDSHLYDDEITPFDCEQISDQILAELRSMIRIPDFRIRHRWHGIYARHPHQHVFISDPQPGVKIIAATGGSGMTLSFAIADQVWEQWS